MALLPNHALRDLPHTARRRAGPLLATPPHNPHTSNGAPPQGHRHRPPTASRTMQDYIVSTPETPADAALRISHGFPDNAHDSTVTARAFDTDCTSPRIDCAATRNKSTHHGDQRLTISETFRNVHNGSVVRKEATRTITRAVRSATVGVTAEAMALRKRRAPDSLPRSLADPRPR